MRVRLKGINRSVKKLASGKSVTYYYAWRGGPRLEGEPGTPEFAASYQQAVAERSRPEGSIDRIVDLQYERSAEFADLAERTRKDYRRQLSRSSDEFKRFSHCRVGDRRTRCGISGMARKAGGQIAAAGGLCVLRCSPASLSWAYNRGLAPLNPCERPGRLYRASRSESVWTEADERAFHAKAPRHLGLALKLACGPASARAICCASPGRPTMAETIRLRQRKTSVPMAMPVGAPLKAALEAMRAKANSGQHKPCPQQSSPPNAAPHGPNPAFAHHGEKRASNRVISGVTFHDLRGTAVTRLAVAGATVPEIAAITGHSLKEVGTILDTHYMHRDPALGEAAIRKLEERDISPN